MNEDHDHLPSGWGIASIGEVCNLNPPKPKLGEVTSDTQVTFVPMPAVDADSGAITKPQIRQFDEVRKGFTSFKDEDVILAKITPCFENGKAAICRGLLNGLGFGSTEFHVLRTKGPVSPEYLYHFIRQQSFHREGEHHMTGSVGQKRAPAEWLAAVRLPLPPLAEQKRIVAKLDQVLARVNAARERLAKAPAILKRFRQSVLAAACSGRLTADWREAHPRQKAPSPETNLDDRLLDVPSPWISCRLEKLCERVSVGHVGPTSKHYCDAANGVPFIRSQNVRPGRLVLDNTEFITREFHAQLRKSQLRPGDLLIVRVGANRADACVVPGDTPEINCANIVFARPSHGLSEYLSLYFRGPGRDLLLDETTGSAQGVINTSAVAAVPTPLPPEDERNIIVQRAHELLQLADKIGARCTRATRFTDTLIQATLAKAFRGELVPTEAELARQQSRTFESATQLLARIRATNTPESPRPRVPASPSPRRLPVSRTKKPSPANKSAVSSAPASSPRASKSPRPLPGKSTSPSKS